MTYKVTFPIFSETDKWKITASEEYSQWMTFVIKADIKQIDFPTFLKDHNIVSVKQNSLQADAEPYECNAVTLEFLTEQDYLNYLLKI